MPLTKNDLKQIKEIVGEVVDKTVEPYFIAIQNDFQHVYKRFDQIDKRFEQVYKRFDQVDKRFEDIENRLDSLERRIICLEDMATEQGRRLKRITAELHSIKKSILVLQKDQPAQNAKIDCLNKRVIIMERKLTTIS